MSAAKGISVGASIACDTPGPSVDQVPVSQPKEKLALTGMSKMMDFIN